MTIDEPLDQTHTTTIAVMGIPIELKVILYDKAIEWELSCKLTKQDQLLELFLRQHFTNMIENHIRNDHYWAEYYSNFRPNPLELFDEEDAPF